MSHQIKPGAVLFARNLQTMSAFYQAMLGMSVVASESDHVILESNEFQLVLHGIPKKIAAAITITSPPSLRTELPTKLHFPVASLSVARNKAPALGGAVFPQSKEWVARGFRACDGYDPEGNIVQFRENAL
jgi:catechol 2,3-dioxygenase-like lactoylglutathione lyase family enzyme